MSDLNIPGVNDPYGTQKMITGLMKVKNFKLTQMENTNKKFESDKTIWQSLNRRMKTVKDSADTLFGFNTPFGAKLGTSSDDSILTVQATRRSIDGQYQVKVVQTAAGDSFLSKSLPLDFPVPDGNYVFKAGDKSVEISFQGAKLSELVNELNRKGDGKIKAVLVKDTETSEVLQIQTVGVGAKSKLGFDDAAKALMTQLGVIGPSDSHDTILATNADFGPNSQKSWTLPSTLPPGARLEIHYSVQATPSASPSPPSQGFLPPSSGAVTFKGLTIQNGAMKGVLPPPPPPPAPIPVNNSQVFSVQGNAQTVNLSPIQDAGGVLTLATSAFPAGPQNLVLNNQNTNKTIHIDSIKVIDPNNHGDWKPLNPVSQAQDSILDYEGVRVTRESNTLSDVVPGTTIHLVSPSDKPVQIKIQPDHKAIKDQVIDFLVNYNKLITDINVLTSMQSPDPASAEIIQDATYYTDAEKKQAEKNLGRYQGDIGLNTLKSMLQRAMMDPYGIPGKTRYTLLAQVGISTNATSTTGGSSGVDVTKLHGYIEMNDAKFDASVEKDPESVRALFGVATHGDFIVDSGAAFRVDQILNPYTTLGGFNDTKVSFIDNDIKDENHQIRDYKDSMAQYEQGLKVKFGNMESTLDAMKRNSDQINNIGR